MLATAIIIFREVFEIALILSVIMAATRGMAGRTQVILAGLGMGIIGSATIAYFAGEISNLAEGVGQELFNAGILFAATAMIGWTVIWMSQHARELTYHIKKLGQDIISGDAPLYSMAIVITLAVLREGSEIVLFTYGMVASGQPISGIITGSIIGFSGGAIMGLLLYLGLISISPKHIFGVTTWLLILLASGMASIGAGYLVAAGHFTDFSAVVWDTSALLPEKNIFGQAMHILIGYSEQPMVIQLIFYAVTFISLSFGAMAVKAGKKGPEESRKLEI